MHSVIILHLLEHTVGYSFLENHKFHEFYKIVKFISLKLRSITHMTFISECANHFMKFTSVNLYVWSTVFSKFIALKNKVPYSIPRPMVWYRWHYHW